MDPWAQMCRQKMNVEESFLSQSSKVETLRENINLSPVYEQSPICQAGTAFQNFALRPLFSNPPIDESLFIVETEAPKQSPDSLDIGESTQKSCPSPPVVSPNSSTKAGSLLQVKRGDSWKMNTLSVRYGPSIQPQILAVYPLMVKDLRLLPTKVDVRLSISKQQQAVTSWFHVEVLKEESEVQKQTFCTVYFLVFALQSSPPIDPKNLVIVRENAFQLVQLNALISLVVFLSSTSPALVLQLQSVART